MEASNRENDNQLATRILEICKDASHGVPHDELSKLLTCSEQKTVEILNHLITAGYITVGQNAENIPIYQYQDPERAKKFSGLDRDTLAVYKLIGNADANGLTRNEIKSKSGMNPKALDQILQALKKRNLIKSEKALNQKNRNVWILFELEPSVGVKGNIFYKKGEFDTEYVDSLYDRVFQCISKANMTGQTYVTKKQIAVALRSSETNDLKDEDIQSIINILVYDDQIEELEGQGYRVCEWDNAINRSVLTVTPCGKCPVFAECREGSMISPEKCIYFLDW